MLSTSTHLDKHEFLRFVATWVVVDGLNHKQTKQTISRNLDAVATFAQSLPDLYHADQIDDAVKHGVELLLSSPATGDVERVAITDLATAQRIIAAKHKQTETRTDDSMRPIVFYASLAGGVR